MIITFIRHSKTKFDPDTKVTEWELTPEGTRLAEKLTEEPDIMAVGILYCSNQKKAYQTAKIINKKLKKDLIIHPGLTELTSVTVKILDDFEKEVNKLYTGERERLNGGESFKEALERFEKTVGEIVHKEKLKKNNSFKNIGIVSHGFILGLFFSKYSGIPIKQAHKMIKLPDYAVFDYELKKFIRYYSAIS